MQIIFKLLARDFCCMAYFLKSLFTTLFPTRFFVHKIGPIGASLLLALLAALFLTPSETTAVKRQIETINQELEELVEMKRGFEGRALRHENQAERLQFIDRDMLEARRHWQLADENRAKAEAVQEKINALTNEKALLLEQLPAAERSS